jgi:Ricin-type beta-trefoil lectin domain-like
MTHCAIKSKLSGCVIDIEHDSSAAGTFLDVFDQTGAYSDNQLWEFVPYSARPGYYFIKSKLNGDLITVTGNWLSGAQLATYPQESGGVPQLDNQLWQFVRDPAGSGYYFIQNLAYGNVIDIMGASRQSGAGLDSFVLKLSDYDNQLWKPEGGPFPPAVEMVTPPSNIGGGVQYIFWGSKDGKSKTPIENFVIYVYFSEDLVISPTSGIKPNGPTTAQPISFQLNGFSPKPDQVDFWQQYGISMYPDYNQLATFAENWPENGPNLFNIEPNGFVTLPNNLTIPKGWTIQFALRYLPGGVVSGLSCVIWDGNGTTLGSQEIDLVGQQLAGGGLVTEKDLSPIVALQLVLVGWANDADATMTSGAGTITYTSTTPLYVNTSWPPISDGNNGTGENSNSIYGEMPAQPGTYIVQSWGVNGAGA